jgi:hypothetical protein
MRSYVYQTNMGDGHGWHVVMYSDNSGEVWDWAGPFEDEYDAEEVKVRADEWAGGE